MTFNAKQYWEKRSNPNTSKSETAPQFLYDFIRPYLIDKTNILELGPGIGRTFDIYKPDQRINTLDLSTKYIDQITSRAKELGLSVLQNHLDSPSHPFPFDSKVFELGICSQVLMHVPYDCIEFTMSELLRTSMKVVIVTTKKTHLDGVKARHVFGHDYFAVSSSIGGVVEDYKEFGNTACFSLRQAS